MEKESKLNNVDTKPKSLNNNNNAKQPMPQNAKPEKKLPPKLPKDNGGVKAEQNKDSADKTKQENAQQKEAIAKQNQENAQANKSALNSPEQNKIEQSKDDAQKPKQENAEADKTAVNPEQKNDEQHKDNAEKPKQENVELGKDNIDKQKQEDVDANKNKNDSAAQEQQPASPEEKIDSKSAPAKTDEDKSKDKDLAKKQKEIKKPNEKFYKTFRILGNVLFVPFFIIILICSVLMFQAKARNEVPSLFGYSAVKILSGSMKPADFNVGDVVMVKSVNAKDLKVGDIIAFYEYYDPNVNTDDLQSSSTSLIYENQKTTIGSFMGGGASNEYQKTAASKYSKVIFHRIVNISSPSNPEDEYAGKLFFRTQGDANASPDRDWIMEDYVVGKFQSKNTFIANFFQFCTSTAGMIVLIIVPSLILIGICIVSIIGEAEKSRYQRKLEEERFAKQNEILDELSLEASKKLEEKSQSNKDEKSKENSDTKTTALDNVDDVKTDEVTKQDKPQEKTEKSQEKIEKPQTVETNKKVDSKKPEQPKPVTPPKAPVPPKAPAQQKSKVPPKAPVPQKAPTQPKTKVPPKAPTNPKKPPVVPKAPVQTKAPVPPKKK